MNVTGLLILLSLALTGCATDSSKKLDKKIASETSVDSRSELRAQARNTIDDAVNLTSGQKEMLNNLRITYSKKTDDLNRQSFELQSILIRDLLTEKDNTQEVDLIKDRLRKLADKRLSLIFEATDKANVIMGRQAADNQFVMWELIGDRNYR